MFRIQMNYGTVIVLVEGDDKDWVHEEARTAYTRAERVIEAEINRMDLTIPIHPDRAEQDEG